MLERARELGLWTLVETHSESEIAGSLDAGAEIIGINNRDLTSMKVDLGTTRAGISPHLGVSSPFGSLEPPDLGTTVRLCHLIPKNKILVTESGIITPEDIQKLKKACLRKPDFYLVGTALMQAKNKAKKLKEMMDA